MRFKLHEWLLLAACLCGALACAALASSQQFGPPGALIPEGKLALVRGENGTQLTPTYCDDLGVNNGGQGAVGAHVGCVGQPQGTICIFCSVTNQKPFGSGGPPGYATFQANCNTGSGNPDKQSGFCDANGNCVHLTPLGANCTGFIFSNAPEPPMP
jgi:hypothetical protein